MAVWAYGAALGLVSFCWAKEFCGSGHLGLMVSNDYCCGPHGRMSAVECLGGCGSSNEGKAWMKVRPNVGGPELAA
ncbi:hypothetical protein E3N88_14041 [Mikania micrantha]|uniref:Secreted protein n=1 Tax=Mikania micrantha TaxID=192012 RepID=A0A5N6P213_9ASTR|nr:hypothetical protein E3N88_14041 [Mikania micrantha]